MTTNILEALIQLFALFAAGRGKEGISLGRAHAARYMRNHLPKTLVDASLERFDELVDQFQRMPDRGEEMVAKRLAKLSVKLGTVVSTGEHVGRHRYVESSKFFCVCF